MDQVRIKARGKGQGPWGGGGSEESHTCCTHEWTVVVGRF